MDARIVIPIVFLIVCIVVVIYECSYLQGLTITPDRPFLVDSTLKGTVENDIFPNASTPFLQAEQQSPPPSALDGDAVLLSSKAASPQSSHVISQDPNPQSRRVQHWRVRSSKNDSQ
jgi:hypothetical protein